MQFIFVNLQYNRNRSRDSLESLVQSKRIKRRNVEKFLKTMGYNIYELLVTLPCFIASVINMGFILKKGLMFMKVSIRQKYFAFRFGIAVALVAATLPYCHYVSSAQSNNPQDVRKQLMAVMDRIESGFHQSRHDAEIGDYKKAKSAVDSTMEHIEMLEKTFMPLVERVKTILQEERAIKNETQNLIDQFIPEDVPSIDKKREAITKKQLSNRNDTLEIGALLRRNIDLLDSSPDTSQTQPSSQPDREKSREILTQVEKLMQEAVAFENSAINWLEGDNLRQAVTEEQRSIEKMEEAVKLLRG